MPTNRCWSNTGYHVGAISRNDNVANAVTNYHLLANR